MTVNPEEIEVHDAEAVETLTPQQVADWVHQRLLELEIPVLAAVLNRGNPGVVVGAPNGGEGVFVLSVERVSLAAVRKLQGG